MEVEKGSKDGTGQDGPQNMPFPHKPQVSPAQPGWLLLKSYEIPKAGEAARDQLLGKQREGHTPPQHRIL